MSAIKIDATKPFPPEITESEKGHKGESFAQLYKRLKTTDLKLISDDMEQEKREQAEINALQKKRFERKRKLLLENLGLILRHREEIIANPRYANIDVHYVLWGGGLYVGPLCTYRHLKFAGTFVTINLKLGTPLEIWDTDQFKAKCECGSTAYVCYFSGSPLSGSSVATAFCPNCHKHVHGIKFRSFGAYYFYARTKLAEDVEKVARSFVLHWKVAEEECKKKIEKGNYREPRPGSDFYGDEGVSNLETMINELKLKEFREKTQPSIRQWCVFPCRR